MLASAQRDGQSTRYQGNTAASRHVHKNVYKEVHEDYGAFGANRAYKKYGGKTFSFKRKGAIGSKGEHVMVPTTVRITPVLKKVLAKVKPTSIIASGFQFGIGIDNPVKKARGVTEESTEESLLLPNTEKPDIIFPIEINDLTESYQLRST